MNELVTLVDKITRLHADISRLSHKCGDLITDNGILEKENEELKNFLSITDYDECQQMFFSDFPHSVRTAWGKTLESCFDEFKKVYRKEQSE